MGVVRTVHWKLTCPANQAVPLLLKALEASGFETSYSNDHELRAKVKMSWLKNRYSADVSATVAESADGSASVTWSVDMIGSKHSDVINDIADALPDGVLDDRGVGAAMQRLGKAGRMFGRKELRNLSSMIYADENVIEIGQGTLDNKQGIVVLTNERLFFFEKSGLVGESLQQFSLDAIQALSTSKRMTGERLEVAHAGLKTEIKQMGPGQSDALINAFRNLKRATSAPVPTSSAAPSDPVEQMQQLKRLLDAGLITESEFNTKRATILDRM